MNREDKLKRQTIWNPWAGGICPVAGKVTIEAKLRNGITVCGMAREYNWLHNRAGLDIVFFRVSP